MGQIKINQSSVEWLQWALEHTILTHEQTMQTIGLFEQAKAMHQEEVEDFTFEYQRQKTMSINEFYNKIFNKETK